MAFLLACTKKVKVATLIKRQDAFIDDKLKILLNTYEVFVTILYVHVPIVKILMLVSSCDLRSGHMPRNIS